MLLIYLQISTTFSYSMGLALRTRKRTFFFLFGCNDLDLTLQKERPATPSYSSSSIDRVNYEKWERSSHMTLMVIKFGILEAFKGAIFEGIINAKEFLVEIEKQFTNNDKAETTHTFLHLITMKYKGKGNVREQIMETSHIASKLKAIKLEVFFYDMHMHIVLLSLPTQCK